MNNLKKIGLTALAGSLVATSVYAGSLSVSGSAAVKYQSRSGSNGGTSSVQGNPWSDSNGITFSGGEPLWQSENILKLLHLLPNTLDKMLFTGFRMNELNKNQIKCVKLIDILVDGRFEIDKKGDYLWRGSSNQQFYSPTGKYNKHDLKNISSSKSKGLEVKVVKNNLYFYGVPPGNEINKIINNFNLNGLETT